MKEVKNVEMKTVLPEFDLDPERAEEFTVSKHFKQLDHMDIFRLNTSPFRSEKHLKRVKDYVSKMEQRLQDILDKPEPTDDEKEFVGTFQSDDRNKKITQLYEIATTSESDMVFDSPPYEHLNAGEHVNQIHVSLDDKDRDLEFHIPSKTKTKDTSSVKAIDYFKYKLFAGEFMIIPLYHSGFSIGLSIPSVREFDELSNQVTAHTLTIAKKTTGMYYSNETFVFEKALYDFIMPRIVLSSLNRDELKEPLENYISYLDLPIITLALSKMMNPRGVSFNRRCTYAVDEKALESEDAELEFHTCNKVIEGLLDVGKLLFVRKDKITNPMLGQLAERRPNTISLSDIEEYQKAFESIIADVYEETAVPKEVELKFVTMGGQDMKVKVTFQIPSLGERIKAGDTWIEILDKVVTETSMKFTSEDQAKRYVAQIIGKNNLGLKSHFIHSIQIEDIPPTTKRSEIENLLEQFITVTSLGNEQQLIDLLDSINYFVQQHQIAIPALPAYICPSCKKKQAGLEQSDPFYKFIPLNIYRYFFTLGNLRLLKTRRIFEEKES